MRTARKRRAWVLGGALSIAAGSALAGCRGFVNASPNIRWWLFSNFGAQRMCPEMTKRSAPLTLSQGGNVIGRFFPTSCSHTVNDDRRTVTIHFQGTGYAWTPVAGRIGFACEAAIEYAFDFHLGDDATYVWATNPHPVLGPKFTVGAVENRVVDWATTQTPAGYLVNTFGQQIVLNKLTAGFTVIRSDEGDEFSLGKVVPPHRPKKPFALEGDDRMALANEVTEIRNQQVDFLGPFEVADDEQALYVRFRLDGLPVDVLVFHRGTADLWRDGMQRGLALGPPPQPPLMGFVVQPGREHRQRIPLPRGQYTLVVDNSNAVGQVAPPWNPLSVVVGNAAVVSYTVELGDADED